jgi:hypothetical protein
MPMDSSERFIFFHHGCGAWCAAPPGFRNLLLDPVGLGETRVEAARELLDHPAFIERASRGEWSAYAGLNDFLEVPEPDCAKFVEHRPEPESSHSRVQRRRQLFRVV